MKGFQLAAFLFLVILSLGAGGCKKEKTNTYNLCYYQNCKNAIIELNNKNYQAALNLFKIAFERTKPQATDAVKMGAACYFLDREELTLSFVSKAIKSGIERKTIMAILDCP